MDPTQKKQSKRSHASNSYIAALGLLEPKKAIETGIMLLVMNIKNDFMYFFKDL